MDRRTGKSRYKALLPSGVIAALLLLGGCATDGPDFASEPLLPSKAYVIPAESIGPALAQAEMNLVAGEYQTAFRTFNAVLRAEPGNPRALLGAGECQLAVGKPEQALAAFESLMDSPEYHARALQGRGIILSRLGQREMGQELLLNAVAENANLWRAWNTIGLNYNAVGDWTMAQNSYLNALAANGAAPAVYNNMGMGQMMRADYEPAAQSFRRAIALDPSSAVPRMNLRLALAWQGRYGEALAGLNQAMLPKILNNVGFIATRRGDYDEAEAFLVRAMEMSPSYYEKAARNLEQLRAIKRSASSAGAQG